MLYLPNLGRDASTLAIFQPGVSPEGSVAGAMYDQNTFQLDGGNNSNDMDGSMRDYTGSFASNGAPSGVLPTGVESIEELKVNTSGQTADFNGSTGSQVTMWRGRVPCQWRRKGVRGGRQECRRRTCERVNPRVRRHSGGLWWSAGPSYYWIRSVSATDTPRRKGMRESGAKVAGRPRIGIMLLPGEPLPDPGRPRFPGGAAAATEIGCARRSKPSVRIATFWPSDVWRRVNTTVSTAGPLRPGSDATTCPSTRAPRSAITNSPATSSLTSVALKVSPGLFRSVESASTRRTGMIVPAFSVALCGSGDGGGTGVACSCSRRADGLGEGAASPWALCGVGSGKGAGSGAVIGTDTSSG